MRRVLADAAGNVAKHTRLDIQNFHVQTVRPERIILSLAGDLKPEEVATRLARHFGSWRPTEKSVPLPDLAPMPVVKTILRAAQTIKGKSESIVVLGHQGITRQDPDYYKVYIANHILGGAGLSSRLMKKVRDEAGLTYSIYSAFSSSRGERPWYLMMQTDPKDLEKAVQLSLEEIRNLQQGRIAEAEFKDAQEQLVGGLEVGLETNSGIAHLNREIMYQRLGADYLTQFPQRIREVTFAQVVEAARNWFHPESYVLSSAGPEPVPTPGD
jgi:zinc protease